MKKQVKLDTAKLLGVRLVDSSAKNGSKGSPPPAITAMAGTKGGLPTIGAMAGAKGPVLQ